MDKRNRTKKTAIISVLIFLMVAIFVVFYSLLLKSERDPIHEQMRIAIQEGENTEELREMLAEHLTNEECKTESERYFINGYLSFLNGEKEQALWDFTKARDLLQDADSVFIKTYTYVFLNMLMDENSLNEEAIENSKNILFYMAQDEEYRNDSFLQWQVVYHMVNAPEQGAELLSDYLNDVKGLTNETKVKMAGNIGQLLSVDQQYSEALFYYFGALYLVETAHDVPNRNYYEMKLLTCIGDISFSIEEYQDAITFYDRAIDIPVEDKEAVINKALVIINASHAYIALEQYNEVDELVEKLEALADELPDYAKDDIEILKNNVLAEKSIETGELDSAEVYLDAAIKLVQTDTQELVWNKEIYVQFTYAKLCKARTQYDESILCFEKVLEKSRELGFGIQKDVYEEISEIYKEKGDIEQYSRYQQLYSGELVKVKRFLQVDMFRLFMNCISIIRWKTHNICIVSPLILSGCVILLLVVLSVFFVWTIQKWRKMSFTDHMTGLNNRKYLNYYLKSKRKKIIGKSISIGIIDIDYFKKYNDFYGHIKGDMVIKEVADTIKGCAKGNDVVIRYGGEEMVILAFDIPQGEEKQIAEMIQKALEEKKIAHEQSEVSDNLTVSIGIYRTDYEGQNIYTLIDKADTALYCAKKKGRNCYEVYEDTESKEIESAVRTNP